MASSQVRCQGCATVLAYPVTATSVRCPICQEITTVQQIQIQCNRCRTPLRLPIHTTLASCPCCSQVMRVPPHAPLYNPNRGPPQPTSQQQQQQPAPQPPKSPKSMVYVENPPSMVNGKLVTSVSIGTKTSGGGAGTSR
eukprot:Sspe_Gene.53527::Locus_29577_Transcript_1_3_Confidence_0.400_Length_803::g.53527::m.53527